LTQSHAILFLLFLRLHRDFKADDAPLALNRQRLLVCLPVALPGRGIAAKMRKRRKTRIEAWPVLVPSAPLLLHG
jgi:hypothetical protein